MAVFNITRRHALVSAAGMGAAMLPLQRAFADDPLPVNIINTQGNATVTLGAVIQRRKYLEEFGVKPNFTAVLDGSKLMGALVSGQSDISVLSGFSQVLTAIERGAKIKIVAGAMLKPEHAVYAKQPGIKSIHDLQGKTVGVGSIGALLHSMMVALLRKYGIDEKTVQFVNAGSTSDVFRAVAAGVVDVGVSEIVDDELKAKAGLHVLKEGDLWHELPEYTFQASYASIDAIQNKRIVLARTLAAYGKMYRFLSTDASKDTFVQAQIAAIGRPDPAASAWQWQFFKDIQMYATGLVLSPERVEYMQKLNVSLGTQKKVMPYAQVVDNGPAQDALKLLGQSRG